MLLKYGLGEVEAAERIERAVLETLNRGFRTADIYSDGTVSIYLLIFGSLIIKTGIRNGRLLIITPIRALLNFFLMGLTMFHKV
jgi:hypothetical protein